MQTYGSIIPGGPTLARILPKAAGEARDPPLSRETKRRLAVLGWHAAHGERVSLTARHFGLSRSTLYDWLRRRARDGTRGLEQRSRRPRNVRQPTWSKDLEQAVLKLHQQDKRLAPLDPEAAIHEPDASDVEGITRADAALEQGKQLFDELDLDKAAEALVSSIKLYREHIVALGSDLLQRSFHGDGDVGRMLRIAHSKGDRSHGIAIIRRRRQSLDDAIAPSIRRYKFAVDQARHFVAHAAPDHHPHVAGAVRADFQS